LQEYTAAIGLAVGARRVVVGAICAAGEAAFSGDGLPSGQRSLRDGQHRAVHHEDVATRTETAAATTTVVNIAVTAATAAKATGIVGTIGPGTAPTAIPAIRTIACIVVATAAAAAEAAVVPEISSATTAPEAPLAARGEGAVLRGLAGAAAVDTAATAAAVLFQVTDRTARATGYSGNDGATADTAATAKAVVAGTVSVAAKPAAATPLLEVRIVGSSALAALAADRRVVLEVDVVERDVAGGRIVGRVVGDEQAATHPGAAAAAHPAGAAGRRGVGDRQVLDRDDARIDEQAALVVGNPGGLVLAVERRTVALDVEGHAGLQVDRLEFGGQLDVGAGGEIDFIVAAGFAGGLHQDLVEFVDRGDRLAVRRNQRDVAAHRDIRGDGVDA
jgi:hypothetical protein